MNLLLNSKWLRLSICLAASSTGAQGVNVISFNAIAAANGGMLSSDTAGAISVNHWNNTPSGQTNPSDPIAGSLGAETIIDSNGNVLPTMTLTFSGFGISNNVGGTTGNERMFQSEWDPYNNSTATTDMALVVSNVPYSLYDVYYYVQDADNVENRGGNVTANGITESITMFNFPADIPGGNSTYVEADNQFSWNATTTRGTYLRIQSVSGSTLNLDISAQNPGAPRLRFSGFQIVQIPEPAPLSLGALAMLGFLRRKR